MAIEEHAERLLRYRASGDSQDSYAAPPMSQSSPPFSPSHQPVERAPRQGGGEGEGSGQPSAPEFSVEQHGPDSADHGEVVVHGQIQPMGAPADGGEDEVAITRVTMVTTTVAQIENRRKRGRSPQVKVKTKSSTETTKLSRVMRDLFETLAHVDRCGAPYMCIR